MYRYILSIVLVFFKGERQRYALYINEKFKMRFVWEVISWLGTWVGTGAYICVSVQAYWGFVNVCLEVAPGALPSNANTTEGPNFRPQIDAWLYTAMESGKRQTLSSFFVH